MARIIYWSLVITVVVLPVVLAYLLWSPEAVLERDFRNALNFDRDPTNNHRMYAPSRLRLFHRVHPLPNATAIAVNSRPRRAILFIHDGADHGGRLESAARQLAEKQNLVYLPDLRGHGRSQGRRFFVQSIDEYVADVAFFANHIRDLHPNLPLVLIGHGIGALVVGAAANEVNALAVILSGACLSVGESTPMWLKLLAPVLSFIFPELHIAPVPPSRHLHSFDDPFLYDEGIKVGTINAILQAIRNFPSNLNEIDKHILLLHGTADHICSSDAAVSVLERSEFPTRRHKRILRGVGHDLWNDDTTTSIVRYVDEWLAQHV